MTLSNPYLMINVSTGRYVCMYACTCMYMYVIMLVGSVPYYYINVMSCSVDVE